MPRLNSRPFTTPARLGWRPVFAWLLLGAAAPALAADSTTVSVGATVLSKNNCKFRYPGSATLAFGNIDPSSSANATAAATLTIRCAGASPTVSYALSHDSGLYETGVNLNRMKHATQNAYLPYALTLTPSSGTVAKNVDQTITLTSTVTPAGFQNAAMGAYADTVVITLSP
ncbi:MAG: spore coat protein U domain-containing protein [Burkholderiales bacterium]|nr:spore coat protein U domain-containing protein [Burkholderiales bacterium]